MDICITSVVETPPTIWLTTIYCGCGKNVEQMLISLMPESAAMVILLPHGRITRVIILQTGKHPGLLISLFKSEVPELAEGIVEIKGAVREPGSRAKIAVVSHDIDVDPVGACVGMRGARVQNVVTELRGERIDIIPWSPDHARFACSALAPADVSRVYIDDEGQLMEIIVPDDQLSLAIGKKGQNVRLAAKLIGWKIDIKSETRAQEEEQEEKNLEASEESEDNENLSDSEVAEVEIEESAEQPEVDGNLADEVVAEDETEVVADEATEVKSED
jgi:N utilization substance protein A